MTKTYRHLSSVRHTIFVKKEGIEDLLAVTFDGGIRHPKLVFGKFTTADKKLQAAIENHPGYGKEFTGPAELAKQPKKEDEEPPEELTGKETVEVNHWQQSKKFLIEQHEVDPQRLQTKEMVENVAEELGVVFRYVTK